MSRFCSGLIPRVDCIHVSWNQQPLGWEFVRNSSEPQAAVSGCLSNQGGLTLGASMLAPDSESMLGRQGGPGSSPNISTLRREKIKQSPEISWCYGETSNKNLKPQSTNNSSFGEISENTKQKWRSRRWRDVRELRSWTSFSSTGEITILFLISQVLFSLVYLMTMLWHGDI